MNLHAQTKSIIAVILVLLSLAGAYFLLTDLWPKYNSAQSGHKQTVSENTRLNQALSSLQTFISAFKEQEDKVALTNLALPSKSSDMANFSNLLSQLAAASGVSLGNLSVTELTSSEQAIADNSIQAVDINLSASGGYLPFKDFMSRLEKSLRLVDVYHITLRAETTSGAASILNYLIRMHTYYQK